MTLPVIVTRTLPGADDTARRLAALGFAPILSPMLRLAETGLAPASLAGIRHLVFTSANGVRAAGRPEDGSDLTAWCVGPSTAEAARAAGYGRVVEGEGDAGDLTRLILAARPPGPVLHIANEAAVGELVAALKAGGLDARFSAPYRTEPAAAFALEALTTLAGPGPSVLLVHSAKAARAAADLSPPLASAALVALSEAARAPLKGAAGRGDWVAARPNEESLLDALQAAASALTA